MDYEQLFAQFLIAVFTILFMFIITSTQRRVEEKYKKTEQKLERLKERASKIEGQENEIYKRILQENLTHHRRSIIAASVRQTIDEEIGKLHNITDSIRSVKHLPRNAPDSQSQVGTFFTNTIRKDTILKGLERKYRQCKTNIPETYLQPLQSNPSMFSTKKQPRFRQYSIYHFRVYLNNGITPLNIH